MRQTTLLFNFIIIFFSITSCQPVNFSTDGIQGKNPGTDTDTQITIPSTTPPTTNPPTTGSYLEKTKTVTVDKNMTQIDLLLIIDDSSSMEADNARLASRLGGFVNSLSNANLDWQMCVTTTDVTYYGGNPLEWSGLSNHILNAKIGNLSTIIQQTIYDIGSGYSNDEQAIKAAHLNISKNANHLCHRPGSTLATIIISDEDERSVGGVYRLSSAQYKALTAENSPDTLISFVQSKLAVSGSEKKFKNNSIIVTEATCESAQDKEGSPSFIGTKYIELTQKTKGSLGSICDVDYSKNLNVFSEIIRNSVSSVKLECTPMEPVRIEGLPDSIKLTNKENNISFDPALSEGMTITINYKCAK